MNNWKIYKKCDDFRVAAPKSVSDLVEIKSMRAGADGLTVILPHLR